MEENDLSIDDSLNLEDDTYSHYNELLTYVDGFPVSTEEYQKQKKIDEDTLLLETKISTIPDAHGNEPTIKFAESNSMITNKQYCGMPPPSLRPKKTNTTKIESPQSQIKNNSTQVYNVKDIKGFSSNRNKKLQGIDDELLEKIIAMLKKPSN